MDSCVLYVGNSKFSMLEGTARDGHMCDDFFGNLGVAMMHLTTVKKSVCDWKDMVKFYDFCSGGVFRSLTVFLFRK